ncbi:MAG: SGNH/GDSL hydrolase family protein, partial [Acidobacteriaceae bacterium]
MAIPLIAEKPASIPEEIEWTWEVRPPHPDPQLPDVLLLGDSISRNYFPEVRKDLIGVANVYLMASSTCVGDPRMEHQIAEFATMEGVRFSV